MCMELGQVEDVLFAATAELHWELVLLLVLLLVVVVGVSFGVLSLKPVWLVWKQEAVLAVLGTAAAVFAVVLPAAVLK